MRKSSSGRGQSTPGYVAKLYRSQATGKTGRGCGKPAYPSKKIALGQARSRGWDDAYHCPVCGKWHAGTRRD